jgi:hypothetical protein
MDGINTYSMMKIICQPLSPWAPERVDVMPSAQESSGRAFRAFR